MAVDVSISTCPQPRLAHSGTCALGTSLPYIWRQIWPSPSRPYSGTVYSTGIMRTVRSRDCELTWNPCSHCGILSLTCDSKLTSARRASRASRLPPPLSRGQTFLQVASPAKPRPSASKYLHAPKPPLSHSPRLHINAHVNHTTGLSSGPKWGIVGYQSNHSRNIHCDSVHTFTNLTVQTSIGPYAQRARQTWTTLQPRQHSRRRDLRRRPTAECCAADGSCEWPPRRYLPSLSVLTTVEQA